MTGAIQLDKLWVWKFHIAVFLLVVIWGNFDKAMSLLFPPWRLQLRLPQNFDITWNWFYVINTCRIRFQFSQPGSKVVTHVCMHTWGSSFDKLSATWSLVWLLVLAKEFSFIFQNGIRSIICWHSPWRWCSYRFKLTVTINYIGKFKCRCKYSYSFRHSYFACSFSTWQIDYASG